MAEYTRDSWARALLARLGVPTSTANVSAITAWETAEGGHWNNPDRYNPLNTSQSMPGATSTNGSGIKAYTSWAQGLDATVKTLTNGRYGGILSALRSGTSSAAVKASILASPWGTQAIGGTTATPAAADGGAVPATTPGATVPVGWHIPGLPWDLPSPGDAISGVEGAAAGIGRSLTRLGIMTPIVAGGGGLIVLGVWQATKKTKKGLRA